VSATALHRFSANAAMICLPLMLAPPILMFGPYGITLPEVIAAIAGFILVLTVRPRAGVPLGLLVYLGCYTVGWLGSLFNAYEWKVPIGPWNVTFVYTLGLALLAYIAGRYSTRRAEEIFTSRFATVMVFGVAAFAAAWPLLPVPVRQLVLTPFVESTDIPRIGSPRFPGIGINANQYAFMVYILFLFAFDAYLRRRANGILPLAAFTIILAAASRTVVVLAVGTALVLLVRSMRRDERRRLLSTLWPAASRRRIALVIVIIAGMIGAGLVYSAQVRQAFALYERFEEMLGASVSARNDAGLTGLNTRLPMWEIGMRRVELAPVLGIPRDPGRPDDDTNPLYYYTPHNEFIFVWTTYGVIGLFAHVFLLGYLVVMNLRRGADGRWLLLYGAIAAQMLFDAVFQGPRVIVFAFLVIGLNFKQIAELAPALRAPARDPSPRDAFGLAH
jgi:hypothetical protein